MLLCVHYLPLWPVVFVKDGIIGIDRSIRHQHNGLATLTAPPCLVELEGEEKQSFTEYLNLNKEKTM